MIQCATTTMLKNWMCLGNRIRKLPLSNGQRIAMGLRSEACVKCAQRLKNSIFSHTGENNSAPGLT